MTEERAQYTAEEERAILESFRATGSAICPRCGSKMGLKEIGGGSFGLGYARKREWLLCPGCRRSSIFDAKRGTRT